MKPLFRLVAALLAASVALSALAQQPPAQAGQPNEVPIQGAASVPEGANDEVQPKFIWGLLINVAISKLSNYLFSVFTDWLTAKLTAGLDAGALSALNYFKRDSGAQMSSRGTTAVAAASQGAAPIVVANPDKPLVADGKKENYQGVHMAMVMAGDDGKPVFRAVNEGFRTGERFKLRVVSTFGGELTIENINPRGERRQVFPPRADQVVTLLPGRETLIPMDPNQFFQFAGATGREQLIINVNDPRAIGASASKNKVFRQDTKIGSNFLQEATDGTFPAISQAVELQHSAK